MSEVLDTCDSEEKKLRGVDDLNILEQGYSQGRIKLLHELLRNEGIDNVADFISRGEEGKLSPGSFDKMGEAIKDLYGLVKDGKVNWNAIDWENFGHLTQSSLKLGLTDDEWQNGGKRQVNYHSAVVSSEGAIFVLADNKQLWKGTLTDCVKFELPIDIESEGNRLSVLPHGRVAVHGGVDKTVIFSPDTREVKYIPGWAEEFVPYDDKIVFVLHHRLPTELVVETWNLASGECKGHWEPKNGHHLVVLPSGVCALIGNHSFATVTMDMILGKKGDVQADSWKQVGQAISQFTCLRDGNLLYSTILEQDLTVYDPIKKEIVDRIKPDFGKDYVELYKKAWYLETLPGGITCSKWQVEDWSQVILAIIDPSSKRILAHTKTGSSIVMPHPSGGIIGLKQKNDTLYFDVYGTKLLE